jgi:predicted PurR-regulated permease PerM
MEVDQELALKRAEENSRQLQSAETRSWRESAAWLLLCTALVGVGLYILANYLRALAWALVLAVALWPFYDRVRRQVPPPVAKEGLPILFTALVGLAVFVPVATLAVDAIREVREIVDYGRTVEESGIPVPDFVIQLPYGGQWVADWWREHLSHAGWAKEIVQQVNTSSIRELGANLGANAVHRVVLFGVSLLTLFFLFRHGESISMQCRAASQKLFGERGERIALQMVASVHGTVAGLVLGADHFVRPKLIGGATKLPLTGL